MASNLNEYIEECLESYWEGFCGQGGNIKELLDDPGTYMSPLVYDYEIDEILPSLSNGVVDLSDWGSKVAAIQDEARETVDSTVSDWGKWYSNIEDYGITIDFDDLYWNEYDSGPEHLEKLAEFLGDML